MRIISGKHKGKRLVAPKKLPVRPTTDFAKEALFNILNNRFYFDNISVLDLFSGTGNISYEFASRGTKSITSVDGHYSCVAYIKKTAEELELPITTIKSDVFSYLQKVPVDADIVFADPPYDFSTTEFNRIVALVFAEITNQDTLLIIEHSKHTSLEDHQLFSYEKRYGGSVFSFFTQKEE
jgi:16S rRNA (guanine(966)-N(2))-methyltransferase RsmD